MNKSPLVEGLAEAMPLANHWPVSAPILTRGMKLAAKIPGVAGDWRHLELSNGVNACRISEFAVSCWRKPVNAVHHAPTGSLIRCVWRSEFVPWPCSHV
ncbi:hypothetical protein [Pseudomonas aeruginosa]|uniref:hypothetical protein n=1 Tax=Pseudomonas aeruginosa TaxID=287 RepID=UPI0026588579|nr:hypothetical protein [Pseudomonas aeruginosa]